MSNSTIRKLVLSIILTFGSFLSLPSYAWPEVDHMNMCGPAAKTSRTYGGEFKGWQSRDRYVANNRRAGYYYRNNCPGTAAPVKKVIKKARKVKRTKKRASKKYPYIAKSSKARKFKRTVKYDKHADCVQVDRMNTSGSAVKVVRRR